MSRLALSFSGGETSAFMCRKVLLSDRAKQYDEIVVTFANTGQENEETLEFVERCDKGFGLGVVWVEAVMQHGERKSPEARVVDFASASRSGEPFEEMIRKHGIPNQAYPHCTRSLKLDPMRSYLRSIGWLPGTYDTAVGIRVDEFDRMAKAAKANRIVYPLIQWWPTTKPEINGWWRKQPFRLPLKGYQGNCRWCWKKTFRKHLTIMAESPDAYDFPRRMEAEYGTVGYEFTPEAVMKEGQKPIPEGYRRVFFRDQTSVADLEQMRLDSPDMLPADDDAQEYWLFDATLDTASGCSESCEVFADEDMGETA